MAACAWQARAPSYYRFGQRILYRREDLEDWAEERRVAPGAEAGAARERSGAAGDEAGLVGTAIA